MSGRPTCKPPPTPPFRGSHHTIVRPSSCVTPHASCAAKCLATNHNFLTTYQTTGLSFDNWLTNGNSMFQCLTRCPPTRLLFALIPTAGSRNTEIAVMRGIGGHRGSRMYICRQVQDINFISSSHNSAQSNIHTHHLNLTHAQIQYFNNTILYCKRLIKPTYTTNSSTTTSTHHTQKCQQRPNHTSPPSPLSWPSASRTLPTWPAKKARPSTARARAGKGNMRVRDGFSAGA